MPIPRSVLHRMALRLVTLLAATAALVAVQSQSALADGVAITSAPTSVTGSSAALQGVVNATDADSSWMFEWGTSTSYGQRTPATATGAGLSVVSARITGLQPHTTYHFRLVVQQGVSHSPITSLGDDLGFTTLLAGGRSSAGRAGSSGASSGSGHDASAHRDPGRASLQGHLLTVRHRIVTIAFACRGTASAPCRGRVTVRARSAHGRLVGCATARVSTRAPHRVTVRARIAGACAALLLAAPQHRLQATLRAVFSTRQAPLWTGVSVRGG